MFKYALRQCKRNEEAIRADQHGILSLRLFALYVNQLTDKLLSCNAGCCINDMCINHVIYADDICLLAHSASAMALKLIFMISLVHVSFFLYFTLYVMMMLAMMIFCSITIKSVCTIFKPKAYKLCLPSVFTGSDALKYLAELKYLGFSFCDSKQDDNDILRQMRTVYAKSNTLLRTFSISYLIIRYKLPYFKVIALHCIVSLE